MMNYIWTFMMLTGILFSIANGTISSFTDSLMKSCDDAISFIMALAGIMAVWSGIMKIAEVSGLISKIADAVSPVMKMLFPKVENEQISAMMIMSFMANIFGAGNSATVFSLKAMELMDEENKHSPIASDTMCMFVALTMSMIQLVPITIIKIRNDLGSSSPEDIIFPSILAGIISMIASVTVCKYYERKSSYV